MRQVHYIHDKYDSATLDPKTQQWIKATLANDENSSDEELVDYFFHEGSLTEEEAKLWVSRRSFYLNNIVML